jgi:hypothetical protein
MAMIRIAQPGECCLLVGLRVSKCLSGLTARGGEPALQPARRLKSINFIADSVRKESRTYVSNHLDAIASKTQLVDRSTALRLAAHKSLAFYVK